MANALGKNWWVVLIQGVLAILFGIAAIMLPGLTLLTMVTLFGATAILDGIISFVGAFSSANPEAPRWLFVVRGVIGIAAGIATFAWPGLTALLLIYIIAARFLLTGVLEMVVAIALRKEIEHEWLLIVSGVLSIAAGVWFFAAPGDGALALAWMIGLFAVMTGATLIGASFRLRDLHKRLGVAEQASAA